MSGDLISQNSSFVDRNPSSFADTNSLPSPSIFGTDWEPFQFHATLPPLFTVKRPEQYLHSPNKLLAQLAKSHYDNDRLDDIIYSGLREQKDTPSFKIVSETAYNCLKEKPAQRPDVDQILQNLKKALQLQIERENPEPSTVAVGVERTPSYNHLKRGNLKLFPIPLNDIKLATKDFTEGYLGSGAFAKVYGAKLDLPVEDKNTGGISMKRTPVAIKCITKNKQGEQGFFVEIDLLSQCKHDNIVSLLGVCDEGPNLILVYEHVINGSLGDYFANLSNVTWVQRLKICIDIASGLHYLHTIKVDDEQSIIHRDIKSDNILLGKNLVAKIADFGLSRLFHVNQQEKTHISEKIIAGTKMYMCPEYRDGGKLKKAIDIYSLGVVLFEILSGKLAYDETYLKENEYGIAHIVRRCSKEGILNGMVDPILMQEVDELSATLSRGPNENSLKTFIAIALRCVAETQNKRPTAEGIVKELKRALNYQENKKDPLQISFLEIVRATQNFRRVIGRGGFGEVYEGKVRRRRKLHAIVAKRLVRNQGQGEHQFLTELEILFEYKHEHIIGLVGYCNEMDEKIIVYEHARNFSLDRHLDDGRLTWTQRLKICIDIARGLTFLHGGAPTQEIVIHRDIKCGNILLMGDWKAKISDFGLSEITTANQQVISRVVGTDGYVDPLYEVTGFCTEKSDIYSFGVVLFEILYGQLLVPDTADYDKLRVSNILNQIHDEAKLDLVVNFRIKKQIAPESLSTFRMIVSQCLQQSREIRPTAEEVLRQLNKALEFQEDFEIWKPKLPEDYEELIKESKFSTTYAAKTKKELCDLFSKGILLQDDKVWFSLGINGERNEMISARKFSYRNKSPDKWQSISESRFQEVAKISDISNMIIKIKTRAQFLSPAVVYGVYLVFKFCDSRELPSKPMYVNLKYRKGSEALHSYFATRRDEKWMMVELYQFLNQNEHEIYKFLLEGFSPYFGDDAIYVEGIEFRPLDNVKQVQFRKWQEVDTTRAKWGKYYKRRRKVQEVQILKTNLNMDQVQQVSTSNEEIFGRSTNYNADEKVLWLSEMNGRKHLTLSAMATLNDFSNVKFFTSKPSVQCRFQEVIELLPQQVFHINCTIDSQLLSQDTEYLCNLVFKLSEKCHGLHGPVKVRELLHQENQEAEIFYLIPQNPWNIHDITRVPKQREDRWMEVKLWKFNLNSCLRNDSLPVSLKLISYEGAMSGLIICGLEFQPM